MPSLRTRLLFRSHPEHLEKLNLREKCLADFVKAGQTTSRQILEADFGQSLESIGINPPVSIDDKVHVNVFNGSLIDNLYEGLRILYAETENPLLKISMQLSAKAGRFLGTGPWLLKKVQQGADKISDLVDRSEGKTLRGLREQTSIADRFLQLGYQLKELPGINRLFWHALNVADSIKELKSNNAGLFIIWAKNHIFIADQNEYLFPLPRNTIAATTSHEHIHYLQIKSGMKKFNYLARIHFNPHENRHAIRYGLYLMDESELMPRLHDIVSVFSTLGGKIPETENEFKALLQWSLGNDLEGALAVSQIQLDTFLPVKKDANQTYFKDCFDRAATGHEQIAEGLAMLRAQSMPAAYDLLKSSYNKLMQLYGRAPLTAPAPAP